MQRIFRRITVLFVSFSIGVIPSAHALQGDASNVSKGELTAKIVGGSSIDISQAPWQVALVRTVASNNFDGQFCGGSIISREWIVTAAHCVDGGLLVSDFIVLAGESDLSPTTLSGIAVKEIVINPGWNPVTKEADIALVQLVTPLGFIPGQIEPIRVPGIAPAAESLVDISGWGSTYVSDGNDDYPEFSSSNQKWPTKLQGASISVISDSSCTAFYGGSYKLSSMLCAGVMRATTNYFIVDSCQGDSGGPMAGYVDGSSYLFGIVSWGAGCAWYEPGVYTNVSNYRDWVYAYSTPDWSVTYDASGSSAVSTRDWLTDGQILVSPTAPVTLPNYLFSGWSNSPGGAPVQFPYQPDATSDFTLYALWTIDPVYVAAQAAAQAQAAAAAQAAAVQVAQAQVVAAELASRTVSVKNKYVAKSLAQQTGVVIASPKAKVSFMVAKSSKKICAKSGSKLKTLKAGTCVVTFSVQEPKPKGGKKPKATKTVKTFVVQ